MSKCFCFPSEKGSSPKGKNCSPCKFFLFDIEAFSVGACFAGKQSGSHKKLSSL